MIFMLLAYLGDKSEGIKVNGFDKLEEKNFNKDSILGRFGRWFTELKCLPSKPKDIPGSPQNT